MKRLSLFSIVTTFLVILNIITATGQPLPPDYGLPAGFTFTHPGVLSSQADLDKMKTIINGNESHPMKAGWQRMLKYDPTNKSDNAVKTVVLRNSNKVDSEYQWRRASHHAYWYAIHWVVTGKESSAKACEDILNSWANTHTGFQNDANGGHDNFLAGAIGAIYASAAEILAHYNGGYSGWSQSEQNKFKEYLLSVHIKDLAHLDTEFSGSGKSSDGDKVCFDRNINDVKNKTYGCNYDCSGEFSKDDIDFKVNNRTLSRVFGMMAIGIFAEDQELFQRGLSWLDHFYDRFVWPTGEHAEMIRDCGHANMAMIWMMEDAEVAWQQGFDFYSKKNNRIGLGMETAANTLLGNSFELCQNETISCSDLERSGWEIGYNHYSNRLDLNYPKTEDYVKELRPDSFTKTYFIPWTTVTHAELGDNRNTTPLPPTTSDDLLINGQASEVSSYSDQDKAGSHSISNEGSRINLSGNTWKKAAYAYQVTPNTVLSFEFKADALGEIHAIGLDADNNHENSDEFLFALAGSQDLGELNNEYKNYSGSSWQSYSIPVGQYFTGSINYVALVGDDDDAQAQVSSFRNIQLVEGNDAVTVKVRARMLQGTSDQLELRIGGQSVKEWTVNGSSYQTYSTTVSSAQASSNNIRLYFADKSTDVQVDYLEVDGMQYQTEAQAVNTATWQNGSCGGSYSDRLYCQGYVAYQTNSNARVSSNSKELVEQTLTEANVVVYPNPSSGQVVVTGVADAEVVRVYNLMGIQLQEANVQNGRAVLDLSSHSGMLLLKANHHIHRFIVE